MSDVQYLTLLCPFGCLVFLLLPVDNWPNRWCVVCRYFQQLFGAEIVSNDLKHEMMKKQDLWSQFLRARSFSRADIFTEAHRELKPTVQAQNKLFLLPEITTECNEATTQIGLWEGVRLSIKKTLALLLPNALLTFMYNWSAFLSFWVFVERQSGKCKKSHAETVDEAV